MITKKQFSLIYVIFLKHQYFSLIIILLEIILKQQNLFWFRFSQTYQFIHLQILQMILIQILKLHLSYKKQIYTYKKNFISIKIKYLLMKQNCQLLIINIVILVIMTKMVKYFILRKFSIIQTQLTGKGVFGIYNFKHKIKNELKIYIMINLITIILLQMKGISKIKPECISILFINQKIYLIISYLYLIKNLFFYLFIHNQCQWQAIQIRIFLLLRVIQLKLKILKMILDALLSKLYLQQNKNENKYVLQYIIFDNHLYYAFLTLSKNLSDLKAQWGIADCKLFEGESKNYLIVNLHQQSYL
ncbi:unnamed protein product [Paramecium pentaurelia]|uniref:Transmembrane protein n=1 Tax=Paramecium pentaurelia TaxID=43138 RepID=A0A8S1YI87_9CILI|nr:unnamed protein product [Paramecium pentaurelia]